MTAIGVYVNPAVKDMLVLDERVIFLMLSEILYILFN